MDKKKTLTALCLALGLCLACSTQATAAVIDEIQFCDRYYDYGEGNDSIRIHFNLRDGGRRMGGYDAETLAKFLKIYEDGQELPKEAVTMRTVESGVRIPQDYTFSVLIDQSMPAEGKVLIFDALRKFVATAPDESVFISFFGDGVSPSVVATPENISSLQRKAMEEASKKPFFSGLYSKLYEFAPEGTAVSADFDPGAYPANPEVYERAKEGLGHNVLMVFVEGSRYPDFEGLAFADFVDFAGQDAPTLPRVYAFYYTEDGADSGIESTLQGITEPRDPATHEIIEDRLGSYRSAANVADALAQFESVMNDASYDYELTYHATPDKLYSGSVAYGARWGKKGLGGETSFSIGSAERPWPDRKRTTAGWITEFIVAIFVTALTFFFFFLIAKVAVPMAQSELFRSKYYKKYAPDGAVQKRICHYCRQGLKPGQLVVARCQHLMHAKCWAENGYKCSEYGQNCKEGMEKHADLRSLFTRLSLRDCNQTLLGVMAGFVSWIIYELAGRGSVFTSLATSLASLAYNPAAAGASLFTDCVARTSSFLMIGLLLGFFISLAFRYNDDVRDKSALIWAKIVGLSLLTAVIGMAAFAVGAEIFCLMAQALGKAYLPWYCSLPAYVLFSLCVSLALTIKSTIPVKSALLGGACSAIIGFIVLYCTSFNSSQYDWLNMLLDFIIYGGGLGASLVTVRMIAERYFLVIQNGVKAGQRIPIHKWMNATGGGNRVSIGISRDCEIQMNWEKARRVAQEHAQLYIDPERKLPMIKPLDAGVVFNQRSELPVGRPTLLTNNDTFRIGDTTFKYEEA